jgi:hypothetical protein
MLKSRSWGDKLMEENEKILKYIENKYFISLTNTFRCLAKDCVYSVPVYSLYSVFRISRNFPMLQSEQFSSANPASMPTRLDCS